MKWTAIADFIRNVLGEDPKAYIPFTYQTPDYAFALVNEVRNDTLVLQDARPFIWIAGGYKSNVAAIMNGTDLTSGGALVKIENVGGRGQMQNKAQPITNLFSTRGLTEAVDLPYPLVIQGNGQITFELTNKVAGAQTLSLSFIGVQRAIG